MPILSTTNICSRFFVIRDNFLFIVNSTFIVKHDKRSIYTPAVCWNEYPITEFLLSTLLCLCRVTFKRNNSRGKICWLRCVLLVWRWTFHPICQLLRFFYDGKYMYMPTMPDQLIWLFLQFTNHFWIIKNLQLSPIFMLSLENIWLYWILSFRQTHDCRIITSQDEGLGFSRASGLDHGERVSWKNVTVGS